MLRALLASLFLTTSGMTLQAMQGDNPDGIMSLETAHLIGNWQKTDGPDCSRIYPDRIRFEDSGLYFAEQDKPGVFTLWDVGTFEVSGPDRIRLSTATDAVLTYSIHMRADEIRIRDPDGCEFGYRKAP